MYSPYFDQEEPEAEIVGMIAEQDDSEPYELYAAAVFKTKRGYLVVFVSGCSCWPDRGSTEQILCPRKVDVDRALSGRGGLIEKCQSASWKATKERE